MGTSKRIRKHDVKAAVKNIDLTKAGTSVSLDVYAESEKIGTMELGRGTIRWYGRHQQTPKTISWTRFAEWMGNI